MYIRRVADLQMSNYWRCVCVCVSFHAEKASSFWFLSNNILCCCSNLNLYFNIHNVTFIDKPCVYIPLYTMYILISILFSIHTVSRLISEYAIQRVAADSDMDMRLAGLRVVVSFGWGCIQCWNICLRMIVYDAIDMYIFGLLYAILYISKVFFPLCMHTGNLGS